MSRSVSLIEAVSETERYVVRNVLSNRLVTSNMFFPAFERTSSSESMTASFLENSPVFIRVSVTVVTDERRNRRDFVAVSETETV